jgi:hypothetical protein
VTRVTHALLEDVIRTDGAALPAGFNIGPGQVHHFSVDFGRIVAGFVELDLKAPAGTVVEMHYREKVFRPELAWSGEDPETGARYVAAGTDDQFAALEINGLRYLHLAVHAEQAVSVNLKRLEVREYLYPRTGRAYFRSNDPRLDALYRADVPEWNLVDWASIFLSGRSSILTALWARGLVEFAELSDAIGNTGSASWARELYESLPRVSRTSGMRIVAYMSTTSSRENASWRPPRSLKPVPSSRVWHRESAGVRSWVR